MKKKSKIMLILGKCMKYEIIILNRISQPEEDSGQVFFHLLS